MGSASSRRAISTAMARLDLAYTLSNGGIGVLLGNGDGTFRPPW